jgi:hypothetical protein
MGSSRNKSKTPSGMCGAWWSMSWVGGENRKAKQLTRCLPRIFLMMLTDTAYGG